jgi:uncharacterized protein
MVDEKGPHTKLGTDDPTVQSGMLNVEIKTFWVPFHG